jgi:hypothetical protein
LVGRLGAGSKPLVLAATGTCGSASRSARLAERLRERIQRIK